MAPLTLADLRAEDLALVQQQALMRIHLKVTGDTNRLFLAFVNNLRAEYLTAADEDGTLVRRKVRGLIKATGEMWDETFQEFVRLMNAARRAAAWLPFGQLARLHRVYFSETELEEQGSPTGLSAVGLGYPAYDPDEQAWSPVFDEFGPVVTSAKERVDALMSHSAALKYSDGKTLSDRVWQMWSMTSGRLQNRVRDAAISGTSAWDLAKQVDKYVRASARCPRWTSTRLRLTKAEIAGGDRRGLYSATPGNPCEMKGVSYAALRMARNEIQIIHHMSTDRTFAAMPWVTKEQIVLSPDHPDIGCECEDIVAGGEKGDGVYPKGQVLLPVHVQCLCFKVAVLQSPKWFASMARGWMRGERSWPQMDRYAEWLGFSGASLALAAPPSPEPTRRDRQAAQDVGDVFPAEADLGSLEVVKSLGGSTGAELVRDPRTGTLYVRKYGASKEHLQEECTADAIYQAMGVNVPEFRLYDDKGRPVKLSRYIEGDTLAALRRQKGKGAVDRLTRALDQLREGFVADVLLGNWDVIGLDEDNILIDAEGNAWRIDNGGSLRYRAQGRKKDLKDWTTWATELWSMRDASMNSRTAGIFGPMSFEDIVGQIEKLGGQRGRLRDLLAGTGVSRGMSDMLLARLDGLVDLAATARTMGDDRWKWEYVDGFCRHLQQFRARGISAALPKRFSFSGVSVRDEKGLSWDHLRGRNSINKDVDAYMREQGGAWSVVARWMGSQAGSSWSSDSKAVKYWLADQRTVDMGRYYWGGEDPARARSRYETAISVVGQQRWWGSYQVYHAWMYEILHSVDFAHNDRGQAMVGLARTENRDVVSHYKMRVGQTTDYVRGACESCSIAQTVVVAGNHLQLMRDVPHHRVMGIYFTERTPGSSHSPFLGDGENEFVTMLEGIPAYYAGTCSSGQATSSYWKKW